MPKKMEVLGVDGPYRTQGPATPINKRKEEKKRKSIKNQHRPAKVFIFRKEASLSDQFTIPGFNSGSQYSCTLGPPAHESA